MASVQNDDFVMPAYPAGSLMWHILKKGFQAGSVIGIGVVVPTLILWKKVHDPAAFLRAIGYSAAVTTAASAAMGGIKFTSIDAYGFEDRVYRLHYNAGQNRTDAFSTAGALVGFAAAALLLPRGAGGSVARYGMAMVGGAGVGTAVGVAVHVATSKSAKKE